MSDGNNGATGTVTAAVAAAAAAAAGIGLLLFGSFSKANEGKTMKAPGQDHRILRKGFEENPAAYFTDLHRKK
ncbi:unnamed protein product [Dovyalis caffra]|uniref:Uncharacterized protein n=1 Tax=Dovyalis caffra TaxID=77055 RepID=A0AAV1QPM9_9ROSI|nr:unnamed protein product [Dovyalis caffra]